MTTASNDQADRQNRAQASAFIEQRAAAITCGGCGKRKFTLGNPVHLPMTRDGSDEMGAFTVFPFVCDHCGHTHFFNAAVMGFTLPS